MRYRYRETYYDITVREADPRVDEKCHEVSVTADGVARTGNVVVLADDRREHRVEVCIPSGSADRRPFPAEARKQLPV